MIEINGKKLCESCFAEVSEGKCQSCGYDSSDGFSDPLALPMGTKLCGKFVVGRIMGKGGFGITYLGYDTRMDKVIAIKEYYPNGIAYRAAQGTEVSVVDAKSEETFEKGAEKFYAEAEMVAQFNGNPNIVSVYDYFRANNTVYLIMEYISGVTLKKYIKRHGSLTDGQALFVMDKIAAALSITHSAGVLHRDISPDNIMLCRDGKVKLIDFGAARQIMAESSSNLTVIMKPGYTPIEQYTKKGKQGAWTDIYSLGVSIYFALTGVVIEDPYARMEDDGEFASNKHGINGDLWEILKKCTMINASDRYGSAIDLRKALKSVSAPIKAEPVALTESDLAEEPEREVPMDKTIAADDSFPVTAAAAPETGDEAEVIEIFDDSSDEVPDVTLPSPPEIRDTPVQTVQTAEKSTAGTGRGGKKAAVIGICAAAVAVLICAAVIFLPKRSSGDGEDISVNSPDTGTVTVTEAPPAETEAVGTAKAPKQTTVDIPKAPKGGGKLVIDDSDLTWSLTKTILSETLESFDGDILVTLEISEVSIEKDEDGLITYSVKPLTAGGSSVNIKPVDIEPDDLGFMILDGERTGLSFVIPQKSIMFIGEKLSFETHNVLIKSVTLEKYEEAAE